MTAVPASLGRLLPAIFLAVRYVALLEYFETSTLVSKLISLEAINSPLLKLPYESNYNPDKYSEKQPYNLWTPSSCKTWPTASAYLYASNVAQVRTTYQFYHILHLLTFP